MLNDNNPLGPGLVIGIPFCGRPVMPEWALAMISMNYPLNTSIQYVTQRGTETGIARNNVVKQALEVGAKYVWFIDDDVAPPYYALRKLMYELDQRSSPVGDAGVIGGIYCAKCDPPTPLVYDKLGSGTFWNWKVGDVFEVGAVGTGCMLIRTDVFRDIKEPWFRTVDDCPDPLPDSVETRLQMSDDLYFCKKIIEAGYKIFAHGGVLCIHWDVPTQKGYILPEGCYPLKKEEESKRG